MNEKKTACLFLGLVAAIGIFAIAIRIHPFKKPLFKTVITFSQYWQDEAGHSFLLPLIEEFHRENPKLEVQLIDASFHYLEDELKNAALQKGKKSLPDIVSVDPRWFSFLKSAGILEPLEDYFKENSTTEEPMMDQAKGDAFTVPLASFFYVLFYNIDVLQKAGIDRPPKTQEEFLTYCRTLSSSRPYPMPGVFSMALLPADPHSVNGELFSWILASGVRFGDSTYSDNSRPLTETLSFLYRMFQEKLLNPDSFEKTETDKLKDFTRGRSPMMLASISKVGYVRKEAPDLLFGISTIPNPLSYSGKPVVGIKTWQAGIVSSSKRKEAAWRFLVFLAGKKINLELAQSVYGIPANQNALLEVSRQDAFYEKALTILEAGDGVMYDGVIHGGAKEQAGSPESIIREEVRKLFNGEVSPEKTGRTIHERMEALQIVNNK